MKAPSIMVVDDNPITRKLVRVSLKVEGYSVLEALDGKTALELMKKEHPSLILLDLLLPDISGFDLIYQLRSFPEGETIPILAFSGLVSGMEDAQALGFTDVLLKPVEPSRMLQTIRSYVPLIAPQGGQPGKGWRVLMVDDDPLQLKLRSVHFRRAGFEVITASDGLIALEVAHRTPPDAVVSDILLPGMDGFRLCQTIRKDPKLSRIPVVLVSVYFTGPEDQALAQQVGASRLIVSSPSSVETIEVLLDCIKGKIPLPESSVITEQDYSHRLIRQIESQAAINKTLLQQSSRQSAELAVLSGVSRILAATQNVQSILEEILHHTATTGEISRAVVYFYTESGELELASQIGYDEVQVERLKTFFGHRDYLKQSLETRSPVIVPSEGGLEKVVRDIVQPLASGAMFMVPILLQEKLLGGLVLMTHMKKVHEEGCLNFAQTVATQISQAVGLSQAITHVKESEERFRQLAENIHEVFWMTTPDFQRILYISPAYELIWGKSCQSLYDRPLDWIEAIHPEDRERVLKSAMSAAAMGGYDEEYRIIRPDGEIRWIYDRGFPIKDKAKQVYRIAGIAENITERKKKEQELEFRNTILSTQQETSPDAILVVDEKGRIISFNKQFIDLWNIPKDMVHAGEDEVVLRSVLSLIRDPGTFLARIKYLYEHRKEISHEELSLMDGRVIDRHSAPMFGRDDKYYGRIWYFRDITERRQAEEIIQHMAFYDTLTELPNRNMLYDCLLNAIRTDQGQGKPMALLLMDLDHFKEINDTLGHHRGDLLLKEVGRRLHSVLFKPDIVARLGGDEFAIFLSKLASLDNIALVIQKIIQALEVPFIIEGIPIAVEASIGVALYPDHGENPDSLMQRADVAMYKAKETGNGYVIYDIKFDQHSPRRLSLIGELRRAIEKDQLFLHYQPKISFKTNHIIGVEALVRWQHPEYGFVPPDQFILPAEQTGLIHPLTRWVLKTALRQSQAWRQTGLNLPVSVNLSARNLHDPHLRDHLAELLKNTGALPEQLELEITESAIMADPQRTLELITSLKAMGLRFALDDFGIGYSSLAYLKKLPVDAIKIDKSFVIDMGKEEDAAVIVLSTINLAHNLGLKVIAEGVETEKILDQLYAFGCDEAQGYYMSKPLPTDKLESWLKESPWGLLKT